MFAVIHGAVDHEGCFLMAIGGVADHTHCLVGIRSTTRVCDLIKAIKATSAQFGARHVEGFKWRPTYAVFSVSRWNVAQLKRYIRAQKEHHAQGTTVEALEISDETYCYGDEKSG